MTFFYENVTTPKKNSGSRLWRTDVDGPVRCIDFSATDHWTAVGFGNGDVQAINPNGKVVWEQNVGPAVLQVRVLPVKKRIVVLNEYSRLMAFDYSGREVFNKGFKSYWTSFEIQSGNIILWGWKSPPLKLNSNGKIIQKLPIPHPWRRLKAASRKNRFWVVHNEVCLGLYDSEGTNLWLVNHPTNIDLSRTHPSDIELEDWGRLDASDEESYTVAKGVEHKYSSTALLLVNEVCDAYCRFCFRKRLFMDDNEEVTKDISEGLEYINAHPEINNVLLTVDRRRSLDHVHLQVGTDHS